MSRNMAESDYHLVPDAKPGRFNLENPNQRQAEKEIASLLNRGGEEFNNPSVAEVFGALAVAPVLLHPAIAIVAQYQPDIPAISRSDIFPEQQTGDAAEAGVTSVPYWKDIPYVQGEPKSEGIAIDSEVLRTNAINFRDAANGNKIGSLAEGTLVERVSDEEVSAGGYNWVNVKTPDGRTGWIFTEGYTEIPQTVSAELPESETKLEADKLAGLFKNIAIGGTTESSAAVANAWKTNESKQSTITSDVASWQRAVATSAIEAATQTEEAINSFDSKTAGANESLISVTFKEKNGTIDVVSRLAGKEGLEDLFVITQFSSNSKASVEAKSIGFTSYDGLVQAFGSEKAHEMAEKATTITDGEQLAKDLEVQPQADGVFLPGLNKVVPKPDIQGATEIIYNREDDGTYTAYDAVPGQTEITNYIYDSVQGEWIVQLNLPEEPVERTDVQAAAKEVESPALPDLNKFSDAIDKYIQAYGIDKDTIAGGINIEQLTSVDGKPYFVAAYNGNPLLIAVTNSNTNETTWVPATPLTLGNATGIEISTGVVGSYLASWHEESQVMKEVVKPFAGILLTYDFQMYNKDYPDLTLRPDQNTFNFRNADDKVNLALLAMGNRPLHAQNALEFVRAFIPPWIESMQNPNEVKQFAIDQVKTLIERYGNKIDSWVVFGELYNQWVPNVWAEKLGTSDIAWIKDIYDAAREADPDAKLIYSDFDIEFGGDKADRTFETIKRVVDSGASIDAIAFQMHLNGVDFTSGQLAVKSTQLREQIKRYQELGLEVIVGEMDVMMEGVSSDSITRNQIQADIVRSLLTACVEEGITDIRFFSQIDRLSWKEQEVFAGGPDGDPTLFDDQGNPKPSYYAAMSALLTK